jgi:hypothetical protein
MPYSINDMRSIPEDDTTTLENDPRTRRKLMCCGNSPQSQLAIWGKKQGIQPHARTIKPHSIITTKHANVPKFGALGNFQQSMKMKNQFLLIGHFDNSP